MFIPARITRSAPLVIKVKNHMYLLGGNHWCRMVGLVGNWPRRASGRQNKFASLSAAILLQQIERIAARIVQVLKEVYYILLFFVRKLALAGIIRSVFKRNGGTSCARVSGAKALTFAATTQPILHQFEKAKCLQQ